MFGIGGLTVGFRFETWDLGGCSTFGLYWNRVYLLRFGV